MPTVEIETTNRWDALDLARRLPRQGWYLVERSPARWDVCVPVDDTGDELPPALLRAVELWLEERDRGPFRLTTP